MVISINGKSHCKLQVERYFHLVPINSLWKWIGLVEQVNNSKLSSIMVNKSSIQLALLQPLWQVVTYPPIEFISQQCTIGGKSPRSIGKPLRYLPFWGDGRIELGRPQFQGDPF